jgi:hypothetical protein
MGEGPALNGMRLSLSRNIANGGDGRQTIQMLQPAGPDRNGLDALSDDVHGPPRVPF